MKEGIRYQMYESSDGHVLFMASEQAFFKNFCEGIGRPDIFEKWPGKKYGDHARGNKELHVFLRDEFKKKTSAEWIAFGNEHNTPIAPVNTPQSIADDPQFQHRLPWIPIEAVGTLQQPMPLKVVDEDWPTPTHAPELGQHTDEVLREVLGYDDARISALREKGTLGQ
jgi:crotonobetainyl-CoA:carnitine CoA-transferase CaiB-like acyl-CoA transferase